MQLLTVAILLFSSLVTAQTVDPNSIDPITRQIWCNIQTAQCPLICTQINNGDSSFITNTCNNTTLQYSCICANNQSPNSTEYSQTIPYFECTQFNNNCVIACPAADNACQSACRQNHPCGATDPRRYNLTSTSSTMSSITTNTATLSGSGSVVATATGASAMAIASAASASAASAAATQTAKSLNGNSSSGVGAITLDLGQVFGTAALLMGFLASFFLFL